MAVACSAQWSGPPFPPDAAQLSSGDLKEVLGETFVILYSDVKVSEHDAYQQVISPWERQHLLLNV